MSKSLSSGENRSEIEKNEINIEKLFPKCRPRRVSRRERSLQMEERMKSGQSVRIKASESLPILAHSSANGCKIALKPDTFPDNNPIFNENNSQVTTQDNNGEALDKIFKANGCDQSPCKESTITTAASLLDNLLSDEEETSEDDELVIGNVPIARYKESPRRYGPKPAHATVNQISSLSTASHPSKESTKSLQHKYQVDQQLIDPSDDSESRIIAKVHPGYPQRLILCDDKNPPENTSRVDLMQTSVASNVSSASSKTFCDELVKSILTIPEPPISNHEYSNNLIETKGNRSHSLVNSPSPHPKNVCDREKIKVNTLSYMNEKNSHSNNNANLHATDLCQENPLSGSADSLSEPCHISISPASYLPSNTFKTDLSVGSKENKSLNELSRTSPSTRKKDSANSSTRQKYPHKNYLPQVTSKPSHIIGDYLVPKETCIDDVCHDMHNFSLSPEVTDCDSNEIESEFSIEGSLQSYNRCNQMPVLEDGLSSGIPSLENELDDDSYNDVSLSLDSRHDKEMRPLCKDSHSSTICKEDDSFPCDSTDYRNHDPLSSAVVTDRGSNHHKFNFSMGYPPTSDTSPIKRSDQEDTNMIYPGTCKRKMEAKNSDQDFRRMRSFPSDIGHKCDSGMGLLGELNYSRSDQHEPTSRQGTDASNSKPSFNDEDSRRSEERYHMSEDCDTDQETDRLLGAQRADEKNSYDDKTNGFNRKKNNSREKLPVTVLIEGVLFRARYLGSCQLVCEGQPTKATRMMQAEEAVSRIKDPDSENQPRPEVDLFISTEKIMVLNTDLKEIMMDHALRSISYIADIGDLLVLMTRRRLANSPDETGETRIKRIPKMTCHVFESEEAQFIAQSIGQAFQVAFMEFLKANGIEDSSFVKEMDYQEVLNSQEIFGNELEMFARKDRQKEVIVPKQKGEILGMVIVESGWGSMLPTVVIANMAQNGPAARCGHLNIGDQIIAINGISLVGLPLSTCQSYIKNTKNQTAVKLTVVPCAPVVEVKIKRPDTKYQLGFSVQNGVICSLLRGGIAERGGVRVGHRIIEINEQSVVAVPHERIVNLLATSVGEISMKTMPTSMFRLLTGQESPVYI